MEQPAGKSPSKVPSDQELKNLGLLSSDEEDTDILDLKAEIGKLKKELYEIIASHTGQKYEKVHEDSDRDYWMKAPEAKKYGMIDEVLSKK